MSITTELPPVLAEFVPPRGPSLKARREALQRALRLRPWMSNRVMAKWCGVSREMVEATRAALLAAGEIRAQPDRIGADGKRYRMEATSQHERTD
jgi:hypothetical protein